ncbi:large subunit of L-aminoadipate-semialdehyde dehydrogenase [Coemansia reversa NRRL 1564]|uniref:Alpha-aminoadipate reductase n=1 Tax=Coemansia reversa (strain ATCC 12441 / NRRL 1564) TaxID=763665 RepID=A0A2G5BFZ5_COERN|nr:large subunit of L-aminoadipate-semialdehyde dehydrogenase [Coemansia reversa NRRL 1564]|eukprot:PIA17948.1 large subunit of L-aminoadipate-semialdehyde dehydrogenase [Coemansia reversa NRRL 1564]
MEARVGRWQERLRRPTELQLPTDYPRPSPLKVVEAVETFELSAAASMSVLQQAMWLQQETSRAGSPFTVLLAAFAVLLHRYTREEDIVVSSSSESLNPLVLRLAVGGEDTFADVVQMAQRVSQEAAADEVPFAALLAAWQAESGEGAVAGVSHVRFFNQTDADAQTLQQTTTAATELTVVVRQRTTGSLRQLQPTVELQITYNQVLFTAQRIAHIVAQLEEVLAVAAAALTRAQAGEGVLDEHRVGRMRISSALDRQVTPDPTADLHWDEFPGSITEVFVHNALAHPERRFLVESRAISSEDEPSSPDSKALDERAFTYGQVLQAARVLSRTLQRGGVQREDVVVVFAFRGAELVVAILGVLMAGATYSVVDPAYPAARQTVYLSVAQPRALVVLERAGALPAEVTAYAATELDVACTISGLVLGDDGELQGSGLDAAPAADLDSATVGSDLVSVGPESIGTLSFTSGSTGVPKGVRGRHYSLTHFAPWMAREFGLGADDRFTMLSGIAHDPIQRDVFTPAFLGAELHIPSAVDIGEPGRLAEWMAAHAATVTHLTPAMGQLLAANADAAIATLRNAFFVGDLLTKRDCQRLQRLARNCRIVNMYGTTETQRAVSFYAIPPPSTDALALATAKDVIPAGRGMRDVQLLVANDVGGALCGVGEVGEIFVRSGGLAAGYLRLPDATAAKFVGNWFARDTDARDRLYRTGDLGRFRTDGAVECIGRIDDQVKIRGFRIELGEIDHLLAQHPRLRANATLVRRDMHEEQTLVAYVVPSEVEQQRVDDPACQDLIAALRTHLRAKLPAYAVPAVFVPLPRLPLTPNGKVDRAALPFPDTPAFRAAAPAAPATRPELATMSATQRALALVWLELLPLPADVPLRLDADFFDLGGHSVLATRMVFRVRKALAVDAPLGLVFRCPTLRAMAAALDRQQGLLPAEPAAEPSEDVAAVDSTPSYAADFDALVPQLPRLGAAYVAYSPVLVERDAAPTFLLTGATGYLGAFVLDALLRRHPHGSVVCLTRARDAEAATARVRAAAEANLVWRDEWASRVRGIPGDLAQPQLGLSADDWRFCAKNVDAIVHNGALVHWVYPYAKLRAANVLSTIEALRLAADTRIKPLVFVSSTSALDTDHYVQLGAAAPIRESDDLSGSRHGLLTGYGQSKWVAEKLLAHARRDGFPVTIVRPGYVLGHSRTGATNADDFIWRLAKGCVQVGLSPIMANAVNICPVDYVARVVVEAVSQPRALDHLVYHVFNHDRFRFQDLFDSLRLYGYSVLDAEYMHWRARLMESTLADRDSALYPLLHYVLDDLPTSTKSPALDDAHTRDLLRDSGVECPAIAPLVGLYIAYLVKAGFLPSPPPAQPGKPHKSLPELNVEVCALVSRTSNN